MKKMQNPDFIVNPYVATYTYPKEEHLEWHGSQASSCKIKWLSSIRHAEAQAAINDQSLEW